MSERIFRKLPPKTRIIRVLQLFPAADPASELECKLHDVLLDSGYSYKALSYAWKDNDDTIQPTAQVLLHGNRMRVDREGNIHLVSVDIPRNLSLALRRLRHPRDDIYLWADSLCINQLDADERTHQVGLMSEIYRQASEVIIWLGEQEREDEVGDWLHGIFQRVVVYTDWSDDAASRILVDRYIDGYNQLQSSSEGPMLKKRDVYGAFCLIWLLSQSIPSTDIAFYHAVFTTPFRFEWAAQVSQGLRAIMDRTWWRRSWVVQETVLARKATIVYGTISAPWEMFAKAALNYPQQRSKEDLDKLAFYQNYYNPSQDTNDALSFFSSTVLAIESTKMEWNSGKSVTLLPLLRRFRSRKASESRDKVFAFLGLVNDWRSSEIRVDYNAGLEQLYLEAAVHIIKSTRTLDGLAGTVSVSFSDSRPSARSWVTKWNVADPPLEMERLSRLELYKAAGNSPTYARLHESYLLELKGYFLGRVKFVSHVAPERGIERLRRTVSEWEERLRVQSSMSGYASFSRYPSFMATICADTLYVPRSGDADNLQPGHYQRAGQSANDAFKAWMSDDRSKRNRYTTMYSDLIANAYEEPAEVTRLKNSYHYAAKSAVASRALFAFEFEDGSTDGSTMFGIGPPNTVVGDKVFVALGSRVPFIVQRLRETHQCNHGIVEDLVPPQNGSESGVEDQLCSDIHKCHALVGDAFIHGVMDGEALSIPTQPISIFLS